MAIGDDFVIDQTGPYLVVRHVSGTTVYTVNAFFTWLCQEADEAGMIVDYWPMTAETPTAYTMRTGCFLDCWDGSELHKYLSGGSISTDQWDHDSYDCGVRKLILDAAAGLTAADKGKVVEGQVSGDTGRLLGYDVTNKVLYVRPDTSSDTFQNSTEEIQVDSVTCGNMTAVSATGEFLWANPRTVASFAGTPDPQVYIEQDGTVLSEWSALTNWDRGTIDVLVLVTDAGTDINTKIVTAFARQQGDEFSHYQATLTAAGQDVIVLNSAPDLQNTTGSYYLMYDARTAAFSDVGDILTGGTSTATGEIVSVLDWNGDTASTGCIVLRGIKGTFQDDETITDDHSGSATSNGTVGDALLTYDARTVAFTTLGQVITGSGGTTSLAKALLRGTQDDGAIGKLVGQVDHDHTSVVGSDRNDYYRPFADDDLVTGASEGSATLDADSTRLVSGYSDITAAFVNGTATYDAGTGTFVPGERVTWNTGANEGILLLDTVPGGSAGVLTLGNCDADPEEDDVILGDISGASKTITNTWASAHTMDKHFEQQASNPYDVVVECGAIYEAGRTMAQVYEYLKLICQEDSAIQMYRVVGGTITPIDGEIYRNAYTGYAEKQKAPFGENPGGQIFGARGVWFEGYLAGELTNIASLVDSDGDTNIPPLTITLTVGGDCEAGVQVLVARTSAGDLDRATYTLHNTGNTQQDNDIQLSTSITDEDVPSVGVVRVVDTSAETEQRFRYVSWATDTLQLVTEITSTCEAGGSSTLLVDTGIEAGDIEVGDCLWNVTTDGWAHVVSIATNQITTTPLSTGIWGDGNTYSIHTIPIAYDNTDRAYIPFLDERATGATVSKDVLYDQSRAVTIRGRKAGLKSHISSASVTTGGLNVAVIMPTDPNYNL